MVPYSTCEYCKLFFGSFLGSIGNNRSNKAKPECIPNTHAKTNDVLVLWQQNMAVYKCDHTTYTGVQK